jgi:hypothetical protein
MIMVLLLKLFPLVKTGNNMWWCLGPAETLRWKCQSGWRLSVKVGDLVRHTRNGDPFGEFLVVTAQKLSETKNEFVKLDGQDRWIPAVCMKVVGATQ